MARFIPPLRMTSARSNAERRVLEWLARLPNDWVVMHSLGVLNHPFKQWAEIDVVAIGPPGLLAIEVKGGRIRRRRGRWGFENAAGETTWSNEGPFDQVGQAHAALRRSLRDAGGILNGHVSGFAVLLPDVEFDYSGPDVNRDVLLDAGDSWVDPQHILSGWCSYWGDRQRWEWGFTPEQIDNAVSALRPELDLRPSLSLLATEVNRDLTRLTKEQSRVLAATRLDNPRLVVMGRAGTGKTMLALTETGELACEGTVLYLCRSSPLVRLAQETLKGSRGATAATPETLVVEPGAEPDVFDAVVVDEGQDFGSDLWGILERHVAGGFDNGVWRVFLDPAQSLLDQDSEGALAPILAAATKLRITHNCRNTSQIAVMASILTKVDLDVEAEVLGPPVNQMWWLDPPRHEQLLATEVSRLVEQLGPGSVAVITRDPMAPERIRRLESATGVATRSLDRSVGNAVTLATAFEYKGLESDAVVVADVRNLTADEADRHFYVACTRARVQLSVLLHESLREHYLSGARWLGARLSAGM